MLAYQPFEGPAPPVPASVLHSDDPTASAAAAEETALDEAAKMFFRMFDINNTGYVNHDEFMLALRNLTDLRPPLLGPAVGEGVPSGRNRERTQSDDYLTHLEELFNEIDDDKDGLIAYSEFKKFYITIVQLSSSTMHTVDVNNI
jgi:Ca2+-binding EF-hand superfamily protein